MLKLLRVQHKSGSQNIAVGPIGGRLSCGNTTEGYLRQT